MAWLYFERGKMSSGGLPYIKGVCKSALLLLYSAQIVPWKTAGLKMAFKAYPDDYFNCHISFWSNATNFELYKTNNIWVHLGKLFLFFTI